METKGGKKSKKSSIQYESPLGYGIEDVRPHGGSEKFRTAAYSNVSAGWVALMKVVIWGICVVACVVSCGSGFDFFGNARRGLFGVCFEDAPIAKLFRLVVFGMVQCVRKPS